MLGLNIITGCSLSLIKYGIPCAQSTRWDTHGLIRYVLYLWFMILICIESLWGIHTACQCWHHKYSSAAVLHHTPHSCSPITAPRGKTPHAGKDRLGGASGNAFGGLLLSQHKAERGCPVVKSGGAFGRFQFLADGGICAKKILRVPNHAVSIRGVAGSTTGYGIGR